jgi:hypothetical protein
MSIPEMDHGSCEKVLGIRFLLEQILEKLGCTKSLVRSSVVNSFWLATARSDDLVDLFTRRNKPSFLGFVAEFDRGFGRELDLLFPPAAPSNDTARAMRRSFDSDAFIGRYIVGSHGGRLIFHAPTQGDLPPGYHTCCPYSKPDLSTYVATPIEQIPRNTGELTDNTYGQFAVLNRTSGNRRDGAAFFVKDASRSFQRSYEGVRFDSQSRVHVHVCVFKDRKWVRSVSYPLDPPPRAAFHRNPYCVLDGDFLYMMYLVGFIVSFDMVQGDFSVIPLPLDVAKSVRSWFDYTVSLHPAGGIALVHYTGGYLLRWVLERDDDSAEWRVDSTVNILTASTEKLSSALLQGQAVQFRCASPNGRFVLISVGINEGIFVIDMVEKRARIVKNNAKEGSLGRVFPLMEEWPPAI